MKSLKGIIYAMISSGTFGLIPLFTIPLMGNIVGVNLAVSFSCIVGCPICKIYLVDHGYRNFKEKIHFME